MSVLRRRVWSVTIGTKVGSLEVGLNVSGHRCEFKIDKTIEAKPNTCVLRIWNLSREQRSALVEQRPAEGKTRGIPVRISAGYEETGPALLFLGDLRIATNTRQGADWISTIESGDGEAAKQNARLNVAYGPGTDPAVALRAIVKALGLDPGNSAKAAAALKAGGVAKLFAQRAILSGSAWQHAQDFCRSADLEFSVQEGAIQITKRGETIEGRVVRLSPETGLIGSPSVDAKGILTATSLLQDGLSPGRLVVLDSPSTQGNFRIERTSYTGDTHGQPWYAEIEGPRFGSRAHVKKGKKK